MNSKEIIIEYKKGLDKTIFIIYMSFFMLFFLAVALYIVIVEYIIKNSFNIPNIFAFIFSILIIFLTVKSLKVVISPKKYILSNNSLKIGDKTYKLSEIEYRFIPTGPRCSLVVAKLYLKDTKKEIGLLFFNFWGGSLLNISTKTFEKIFNKSLDLESVDLEKEVRELKEESRYWYIIQSFLILFILLIFFFIFYSH